MSINKDKISELEAEIKRLKRMIERLQADLNGWLSDRVNELEEALEDALGSHQN